MKKKLHEASEEGRKSTALCGGIIPSGKYQTTCSERATFMFSRCSSDGGAKVPSAIIKRQSAVVNKKQQEE